jgi:DNA-directed RNA polymerase subunit omega
MTKPRIEEILGPNRDAAHPSLDRLLEKIPNRYILVNVIAKRARDIRNGSLPLVECDPENEDPIDIAIAEVLAGLITYVPPEQTHRELMDSESTEWQEVRLDEG